jgi:Na+-driven multidrug efflux pump
MFFFAVPMILSTFLQLLFNAVDVAVVGKFADTVYQSAVGATSSSIHLIVNLLIGISIGANVAMATAFGARDEERQSRIVHTSMALSMVGGVGIAIFGIAITKPLLIALDTPDEVLPYAVTYMQIYFLGAPANVVYNFGASLFRAIGETKKPLAYLFVSGVINVAINIITVVFLDMNVVGVALGTIISQYVSALWVVYDLIKEQSPAKYDIKRTHFHKKSC